MPLVNRVPSGGKRTNESGDGNGRKDGKTTAANCGEENSRAGESRERERARGARIRNEDLGEFGKKCTRPRFLGSG